MGRDVEDAIATRVRRNRNRILEIIVQLRKVCTKVTRGRPVLEFPDITAERARLAELAEEVGDHTIFLALALTFNKFARLVPIVLDEVLGRPCVFEFMEQISDDDWPTLRP